MKNKGSMGTWLMMLLFLVVIMLLYNIFTYPIALVDISVRKQLNETLNVTGHIGIAEKAYGTINFLSTAWEYWPIFLIFGLVFWGISAMQKREPGEV